jgi:hypothetical protein
MHPLRLHKVLGKNEIVFCWKCPSTFKELCWERCAVRALVVQHVALY